MIGTVAVLMAAALASPGETALRFDAFMALGQSALQARDWAAAGESLAKAVAIRPDSAAAHFYLAQAYAGEKKYKFATTHLERALDLAPGNVEALLDLAAIEENMGLFDRAQERYSEALRAGAGAPARRGLASLLAKRGRHDEAIASLRDLVTADPEDIESRYQLGLALMQKGDCQAAVPEFRAVVGAQEDHVGALFNMGNCLNRLGSRDEAKEALVRFEEVTRRDEERVDRQRRAHFLLLDAVERFERQDLVGAISALDEAAALAPDRPSVHAIRAQILDESGRHEEALESYRRAASLDPTDPVVLVEIGRLLGRAGRFEEALWFLRRAADVSPGMPEVHFFMAAAYRSLGRSEEAEKEEVLFRKLQAERAHEP